MNQFFAKQPNPMQTFLERYGHLSLSELTADWQIADLPIDACEWAGLPPEDFIAFCRNYPRIAFDGIPPSANQLRPPSYLLSQAHRIWLTASLAYRRIKAVNAGSFMDLGSFPFVVPLVLRDYFGFQGRIATTTNLKQKDTQEFLASKDIEVHLLDLDPYVHDPSETDAPLPARVDVPDGAFDVVLCSHVIEHLYHPRTMLGECQRLLRAGGELVVTTDNAMMIDVFANYVGGYGYTFDPVEQTAAMQFHFWRGHVRFFTERDLNILVEDAGLTPLGTEFTHCFYDVLFDEYFTSPIPRLPGWKRRLLEETPWLRNDISIVARKE